jgi:hypothetical protein
MQPDTPNTEKQRQPRPSWPVIDGSYRVGDPAAPVAVCALTSDELLVPLAALSRSAGWEQFSSTPLGQQVNVVIEVTALPEEHLLEGTLAEPSEEDPWRSFRRTQHVLLVRWSSATQVAMGSTQHFQPGALLRARGTLWLRDEVEAEGIAVLTKVATIQ